MKKSPRTPILFMALIALACVTVTCTTPAPTPTALPTATEPSRITPLPAPTATSAVATGDGETIMRRECTLCHPLNRVVEVKKTAEQWSQTISRMVRLSSADHSALVEYLAKSYGP